MKSIKVNRGNYSFVINVNHIISLASTNIEDETFIRVTNGEPILVQGTLREIENKIKKANSIPLI